MSALSPPADATEEVFSLPSLQTAPPTRGDVLRSALERALAEVEATENADADDVAPVAHHRAISTALTALREAPRDALAQATALALLSRVIMPPERADAQRRARADACAVYALDAGAAPLVQHALASASLDADARSLRRRRHHTPGGSDSCSERGACCVRSRSPRDSTGRSRQPKASFARRSKASPASTRGRVH